MSRVRTGERPKSTWPAWKLPDLVAARLAQIAIDAVLPAPAELVATGLARTDEFYQAASLEIGNVAPGGGARDP